MKRLQRSLLALALAGIAAAAQAQVSDGVIKIGVLSDMSSLYTDLAGAGSVIAAKMAIEDSGIEKRGYKIEVVSADHQNKADVGSNIARQWYDVDKVDVIVDVPNSGVALAVNQITKDKGKAFLRWGQASSDLTGKACSPNTVHWAYDTWMLANGTGTAITKQGGDTWFFIAADYAFGAALERDTDGRGASNGGKVVGGVKVPAEYARISRRSCCRRRRRRRRSSGLPTPAATRPIRSSRRPSSASSRADRIWRDCWSFSPTSTRSACRRRRA